MGTRERAYKRRIGEAFADIEAAELPPASAEEAFVRFFQLMDAAMPVIEKFPRPQLSNDGEPEELGFYRRWRDLAARRSRHA